MISRAAFLLVVTSAAIDAQAPTPPATPPAPQIYFGYQVDKPVSPSPKNKAPEYPKELRTSSVEGEVVATFAVDSTGRVILSTFHVVKSDNELFSKAVNDALPKLRFTPAELKGKKVAQRVQMPFQFSLAARDTSSIPSTLHSSLPFMSRLSRLVIQTMTTQAMTRTTIAARSPPELDPPAAGFIRRESRLRY